MKKLKFKMSAIVLFMYAIGFAQSPEEQQAQKMLDSMMANVPADQRQFVEQMMQMGKSADKQRQAKKEEAKKEQIAKNEAARAAGEMDFYWRNTIATDTLGKFESWSYGEASLKIFFYQGLGLQPSYMEVGKISADGLVSLVMPDVDLRQWPAKSIKEPWGEGDSMLVDTEDLEFSYKNATYISSLHSLQVFIGDEAIGSLGIGNAIRPVVNLNSPCCFDKAGDGYSAHWVFISDANSITGMQVNQGRIVHDLDFKAGWNLVMERVEGSKEQSSSGMVAGGPFWRNKYFTATAAMPADAKYYFTANQ